MDFFFLLKKSYKNFIYIKFSFWIQLLTVRRIRRIMQEKLYLLYLENRKTRRRQAPVKQRHTWVCWDLTVTLLQLCFLHQKKINKLWSSLREEKVHWCLPRKRCSPHKSQEPAQAFQLSCVTTNKKVIRHLM